MKNRGFYITMLTYTIWGLLPLYWKLLSHVPAVLILCCRITFSLVFTSAIILLTRRMDQFKALLRDRPTMLKLTIASLLITVNWGTYIYAVASGHTLDASLGYYMNPLVVFAASTIIFKEKTSLLQVVSICVAASGVIITLLIFGTVPITALLLAFTFAAYGSVKKFAHVDPLLSIAIETLVMAPAALIIAFTLFGNTIAALTLKDGLLLMLAGPVTAVPMILYSIGVNHLDFKTVGILQYISPSLMLLIGLMSGEALSLEKLIPFIAVIVALVIYSIGLLSKKPAQTKAE
ncbi:MAG: EamA family transporter RarD [Clostridia bacterium]|nr:EamA family transporter RarD [Clostridia bacterium]